MPLGKEVQCFTNDAALGDPADRALFHYRMSARRGKKRPTFEQSINIMLSPEALRVACRLPVGLAPEASTYVVWGE